MKNIRLGLIFGVIAGIFTITFGGWAVTVFGIELGIGLGLTLSGRLTRKEPSKLVIDALPSAVVAGVVLLILSLLQNYVLASATGQSTGGLDVVLPSNLIGLFCQYNADSGHGCASRAFRSPGTLWQADSACSCGNFVSIHR